MTYEPNYKYKIGQLVKINKINNVCIIQERQYSNWSTKNTYRVNFYGSDTSFLRYEEDIEPINEPNDLLKELL